MKLHSLPFKTLLLIVLLANFIYNASAQSTEKSNSTLGTYAVGYTELKIKDTSRLYKPHTDTKDLLHFRPLELDVWYPAINGTSGNALSFRYFVSLFERRANSFQDSASYQGLTDELMRHFTVSGDKDGNKSLQSKSYRDAPQAQEKFPLIIYLCSYNGMSYENVPLFENIASHGYVVVSITSVGRYPGNMTTKYPDVLEQVKDAEFAVNVLKEKHTDTSRIGVIGYSYGGLAAAILAMRNKFVKAVLSLDGSETHYYGRDKEEDKDFNAIRKNKHFDDAKLSQPYIFLESDHKMDDGNADSVYRQRSAVAINNAYLRLNGTEHEDFSYISNINNSTDRYYEQVKRLSLAFADQYINEKGSAFDNYAVKLVADRMASYSFAKIPQKTDTVSQLTLKGRIVSEKDNTVLAYVNIGIPAKDCGTVSDNDGNFVLNAGAQMRNDTVRISSLGYRSRSFTVIELAAILERQMPIILKEQTRQLEEVVITAAPKHLKTVGNTSTSKFFSVGFPLRDLGSEVGIKVNLGKKTVRLRSFNFNISNIRLDTGTFRLNIYDLKDGLPDHNLLTQNVLIGVKNKPGPYHINLAPYQLKLKGNVFVSLEWIAGKTTGDHGVVFFSAGLLASSYHRKTTEANWTSFKGLGAAFNLQIEEFN